MRFNQKRNYNYKYTNDAKNKMDVLLKLSVI
jgi:hypothetical protein